MTYLRPHDEVVDSHVLLFSLSFTGNLLIKPEKHHMNSINQMKPAQFTLTASDRVLS